MKIEMICCHLSEDFKTLEKPVSDKASYKEEDDRKVTLEETKNLFKLVNPDGDGETVNYARVFRNKIFKLDCCH